MAYVATEDARNVCGGVSYRFVHDRECFSSWFTHVAEHGVRERFWSQVKPGDVVLDAGSAYGSYVLPALARGAAHVYAWNPLFEECALTVLSLRANDTVGVVRDGFEERCSIVHVGLWSEDGWLTAHPGPKPSEFHSIVGACPADAFPVRTLDGDVKAFGIGRADWLKVDVEGAEVEVLKGAEETLRRFRPRVLVENHKFKDADIEAKVAAVLEPLGYHEAGRLEENENVSHVLWEAGA